MDIAEQIRSALGKNFPLDAHGELAVQEIERLRAENEALQHDIARHVAICVEQVNEIDRLRAENERLRDLLFERGAMEEPPCFCCGYAGRRYYQPDQHPCAARHHAALAAKGGVE